MKKVLLAALAFGMVFATSCDKKNDKKGDNTDPKPVTVTASEIGGDATTDVKEVVVVYDDESDVHGRAAAATVKNELTRANFADGKFSLSLPAQVEDSKLTTIPKNYFGEGIVMSTEFKSMAISFDGYGTDGKVGYFEEVNEVSETEGCAAHYLYSDRAVTIKGKHTSEIESEEQEIIDMDVTLNKGWNRVYIKSVATDNSESEGAQGENPTEAKTIYNTTVTSSSSGMNVKWVFDAISVE